MSSSLSSIHSLLGKELSMETMDDGTRIVKVSLLPCHDLTIEYPVIIEFIVTRIPNTDIDNLQVKSDNSDAFRFCRYFDISTNTFSFPWMSSNRW